MMVAANNPKLTVVFNCYGIDGCLTSYQQLQSSLEKEITRVDTFKKDYVLKGNQGVEGFTKQAAASLTQQNQALNDRIKSMNSILSGLGVGEGVEFEKVEPESLEYDEKTGLVKQPKNVVALIGGQMNPPLLDVTGNTIGKSLAGISKAGKQVNKDMTEANNQAVQLRTLQQTCKNRLGKSVFKDLVKSTKDSINEARRANCGWSKNYCEKVDENTRNFAELSETLDKLKGGEGLTNSDISSLKSGIKGICKGEGARTEAKELTDLKKSLVPLEDDFSAKDDQFQRVEGILQRARFSAGNLKNAQTLANNVHVEAQDCPGYNKDFQTSDEIISYIEGCAEKLSGDKRNVERDIASIKRKIANSTVSTTTGQIPIADSSCDSIYDDIDSKLQEIKERREGGGQSADDADDTKKGHRRNRKGG
jgi:predicted  nucleic acid-binding Zn-ribbon protein